MGPFRRTAPLVSHAAGDRLLVVAVRDGVAELERAACLDARAQRAWEALGESFTTDDVEAALDGGGRAAARAFVASLQAHDLCSGNGPAPAGEGDTILVADGADELDAPAVIGLARAVLRAGHRLRFVARGASMRPQVPDGSWLEVEPRTLGDVHHGDIALYATGDRLVAHRIVGRDGDVLTARGDSAARVDRVDPDALLGVVVGRLERTRSGAVVCTPLATAAKRAAGLTAGFAHRVRSRLARVLVVAPLRVGTLRRGFRALLGLTSEVLRRIETRGTRVRRRLDVVRAALRTTAEKDHERRALYADKSIREFTALDENVEAGLTLLEEVMLTRHPLPAGRVLVLGCGPGRECVALARRGHAVTGLDYDAAMLERARSLAARHGVELDLVEAQATEFDLDAEFAAVVIFSGLYNMVLPSARRVAMLAAARRHTVAGGAVYVTFLSDYVSPGAPARPPVPTVWSRVNTEHEDGDLYLLNETIHVFPHPDRVRAEARRAGLAVDTLFRDQRAYDRSRRQVLGYAVLRRPE